MGESSLAGIIQEFVLRKLTKGGHRPDSSVSTPADQTVLIPAPTNP